MPRPITLRLAGIEAAAARFGPASGSRELADTDLQPCESS
jgi:hypothetical protein